MLHDVQRILGVDIDGSLPAEPADGDWQLGLAGLFGEPMSELHRKGCFTSGSISVGEMLQLCHCSQSLETRAFPLFSLTEALNNYTLDYHRQSHNTQLLC